jgi:hypothetical protein
MTIQLRDLSSIKDAAEKQKTDISELLFDALDNKVELFSVTTRDSSHILIPCRSEWIEEAGGNEDMYGSEKRLQIDVALGQIIKLNNKAIKELIINKKFSEVELFRELGPSLEGSEQEYWKTAVELYDFSGWVDNKPPYRDLGLDNVFVLRTELNNRSSKATTKTSELPSNNSLKVIGLLMHHLAKSPKYASGSSPNKSQIKELLLELANELDINNYGLSKVDERLLAEAMKYLETQKN